MLKKIRISVLILFLVSEVLYPQKAERNSPYNNLKEHEIYIDGSNPSKIFEGYGSLSAGASSRLLYDYPEPYRSDILDYLFKPNFGANLHHLKVEIGGDVNSTDGSEPSIAASRKEFENPDEGFFRRGYEYWLMSEAKKRNPNIILEGLQWGAPGWIGNGKFYSKDNAKFIVQWIKGAKKYWNLDIDYVGVRNERMYNTKYIKLLRNILDKNGLEQVIIDAGDLYSDDKWLIADDILKDSELDSAVGVINAHIPEQINYITTHNAKKINKPIWSGESHFYGSNWYSASSWARAYRSYINGGITKVINWSIISSYHDYLVVPRSGIMLANTPWSGHYEVLASIWALAHINQFAKPGWEYLDSGCKSWSRTGSLLEGMTMITLKDPDSNNYSIVIETMSAKEPQKIHIKLSDDLSSNNLALFKSVFKKEEFEKKNDIEVIEGEFEIEVQPNSIYSLTTTRGQKKGLASNEIPSETGGQPLDYNNDFESQDLNSPAKYFSDQHGAFEVVSDPVKKGKCLEQISTIPGICWRCRFDNPITIMGNIDWKDYEFSVDFLIPEFGKIYFVGRNSKPSKGTKESGGYGLYINNKGEWNLKIENGKTLLTGNLKKTDGRWHTLTMKFISNFIEVFIDNKSQGKVKDSTYKHGIIAIGTDWNKAYFDNIKIFKAPH